MWIREVNSSSRPVRKQCVHSQHSVEAQKARNHSGRDVSPDVHNLVLLSTTLGLNHSLARILHTKARPTEAKGTSDIVGWNVQVVFDDGTFHGIIESYNAKDNLYTIKYDDNDTEQLWPSELTRCIVTPPMKLAYNNDAQMSQTIILSASYAKSKRHVLHAHMAQSTSLAWIPACGYELHKALRIYPPHALDNANAMSLVPHIN